MKVRLVRWLGAGLLLGSLSCTEEGGGTGEPAADSNPSDSQGTGAPQTSPSSSSGPSQPSDSPSPSAGGPQDPPIPPRIFLPKLAPASDCGDLLTKIQDDAIAKLEMQVELYKKQPPSAQGIGVAIRDAVPGANFGAGGVTSTSKGAASTVPEFSSPSAAADSAASSGGSTSSPPSDHASAPVGASDTNAQVAGVDEADFVKVVQNGAEIFLLQGSSLQRLKSWPPEQTALAGTPLTIEGSSSEMFVTDEGKAVVFSSVYTYGYTSPLGKPLPVEGIGGDVVCAPGYCGGSTMMKITVADVAGDAPRVEREIYYEGWYVSSRRYAGNGGDVVRAIVQANSKYPGLYSPDIQWYDAWNRPYPQDEIASQLDEWQKRTTASIRNTVLSDWLPTGKEVQDGKLVEMAPACDSYFVPDPGLSDYGLTHVISLDLAHADQPVGGVTVVGATSTVYSNEERLVLAQPDYRWGPVFTFGVLASTPVDYGITDQQQTALHVFELTGATTTYLASGWVFGTLPSYNPQFGIDAATDGTIRVATTGSVRDHPDAKPEDEDYWQQHPENYVSTARVQGDKLEVVGKSSKLGHDNETLQSARFVSDRAYVVTYRQTDPLIVVDVSDAASPSVLGEIQIPGFSEYMHPLDATHLLTFGQGTNGGSQLQLFDVTDPKAIPAPATLTFASGSSSEVSYNHKAFTLYQGVLALPLWNNYYVGNQYYYGSALELVKVDPKAGLQHLGRVDHARLYADNGLGVKCGSCDQMGCYDYSCGAYYQPEVRRGHFVQGDDTTYVYSFSYAGVLVNDLAHLTIPVATVGLPAPSNPSYQPWYGPDGLPVPQDGGVAQDAGMPVADAAVRPSSDAGTAIPVDGGSATMP